MSRALILTAALMLAAPLHHALLSQPNASAPTTRAPDAAMSMLPMASTSAEAKMHATMGQRALDMGHAPEAARHFAEAVAADSTSAFAWFGYANASTSFADYESRLAAAAARASHGTRAEQREIKSAQRALVNDFVGAEAAARELVAAEPRNPRSYLALATVQQQMGREVEARKTMERALAAAPAFSPAHLQLAFSYMTAQPTDPPRAARSIERLVALEPQEPQAFIAQGSFYRATNQLPLARRAYTRAAELDSTMALPLQQRGHVESFLGEYDAARADYDAAVRVGKLNEPGNFRMYRAFVAAHAGQPKQAIAELDQLVGEIDGLNLPDPIGTKLAVLTSELQIATYVGDFESAARAIERRTPLAREQVAASTDSTVKRIAEADIAYWDGLVAARRGDAAAAKSKADDLTRILASTDDPQKGQRAHAILGVLALEQKDYAAASTHLAQANPNDIYLMYEHALALDGAGKSADAKALFGRIARYNFNGADVAALRADATKRAQ